MKNTLAEKIRKVSTNLNLKRTIRLVFSVAKGWTVAVIVLIVVETMFFFGSLYMLKMLVDSIASHIDNPAYQSHVLRHLLFAAGLAVLYNVTKAVTTYISEIQAAKVAEYIDGRIHDSSVRLPYSFFESPEYFDILKRAKDAGAERPNAVIISLIEILKSALGLAAISTVLMTIDLFLLPLLVLLVLPTLLVRIYFSDKLNALRIKNTPTERKAAYLSDLITSESAAKEIRAYRLGGYLLKQYVGIRHRLVNERLRVGSNRAKSEVMTSGLTSLGFFACIGLITFKALQGSTTAGDITVFLFIFPQTFSILQQVSSGISVIYHNNIFVNSIFELFDLKPPQATTASSVPIPADGDFALRFDQVSFTYPHADSPTLMDIDLRIPAGKIVAIVGTNGAGKTTLIKLLCRLYEPTSGTIRLDGRDIRMYDADEYRRHISAVFQDFGKYNVTALDNIRFGDIDRNDYRFEDVQSAARRAGADMYIEQFPKRYETMMGRIFDDGHEVSIGQWQKLATARAFYANSRLLILDEATSALDAIAEESLFDSLSQHIGNRAALVISHRYSTIKQADYIYVLSGGRIVEHGTDAQLMELEGEFSRLFGERRDKLEHI